ncbi:hypothetical protein [Massilia sp. CCM 8734]|uniref:hypothetical protein n=1 Tax=Massilia sp. CCM 8734 TaxID=2609283 RepID=UPI00141FBCB9|nr:hypothetical protein [Massilia sp. CCM 8734]NHZ99364.1 hypothetical protein [Massilia sp. CCM 8734]
MSIPIQCQALAQEIQELQQERADLQAELQTAPTGMKAALASQIRRLSTLIRARQAALNACVVQYRDPPPPPPPPPLTSSFTGTMSLTTTKNFSGEPFTADTNWTILFDGLRTQAFVTEFSPTPMNTTSAAPPLPWPFENLFGPNVTTISKNLGGGGTYSKADGNLSLTLPLRFDHSREFSPFYDDANLSIVLSTTFESGTPLTADGLVRLAGRGVFSGGWLNGVGCTMVVTGTLTPVP